jgi:prepilin-type processing-associated H-X9-DG protein
MLAVLGMIAAPHWARGKLDAQARVCTGNLGQVGRAVAMYANEHEEKLPGNQHSPPSWVVGLGAYVNTNVYRCPNEVLGEQRSFTIALNDFLTPKPYGARHLDFSKVTKIPATQETLMFAEADESYRAYDHFHFADSKENGYGVVEFSEQVDAERHGEVGSGAANYLFADGRVEEMVWGSAVKAKLTARGSKFVNPNGGIHLEFVQR